MAGNGSKPDPVSLIWDRAATAILRKTYQQRGGWYATRIKNPDAGYLAYFQGTYGIDVTGPDNAATISGRHNNYRTRWNRAFVRAIYRNNKPEYDGRGGPIQVQIGRPKAAGPGNLPAGWAVRVRVRRGGRAAMRAVDKKAERDRIWVGDGEQGGRFADISGRDW